MGYEIVFTPTEEKMNSYKPWGYGKTDRKKPWENINEFKLKLLVYCLNDHKEESFNTVYNDLKFNINFIKACVRENERESAYERWLNDKDHELYYCGWEFSHGANRFEEDIIRDCIQELTVLSLAVKTDGYFEQNTNFQEKEARIETVIDEFIDAYSELCIHEIIDDLKYFEKKYNEDELTEGIDKNDSADGEE